MGRDRGTAQGEGRPLKVGVVGGTGGGGGGTAGFAVAAGTGEHSGQGPGSMQSSPTGGLHNVALRGGSQRGLVIGGEVLNPTQSSSHGAVVPRRWPLETGYQLSWPTLRPPAPDSPLG